MLSWQPRGVVHITGEWGSGKTSFALDSRGMEIPARRVVMLDADIKMREVGKQIAQSVDGFRYFDVVDLLNREHIRKQTPLRRYQIVADILSRMEPGEQDLIVFDSWEWIEPGIRAYSETVMDDISPLSKGQQEKMSRLTWTYTYQVYDNLLTQMMDLAPLVIITTHIREKWTGDIATGMMEPRGQRPLIEKSLFRIWLRKNPDGSALPVGIVLKPLGTIRANDEGYLEPVNVLPHKIVPCTWEQIHHYIENPMGTRPPTEDEMPSTFERKNLIEGAYTEDQRNAMKLAAEALRKERLERMTGSSQTEETLSKEDLAKKLSVEGGMSPQEIADELGVPLPFVKKWIGGNDA